VIAFDVIATTVEIIGVHYGGARSTQFWRPTTHRCRQRGRSRPILAVRIGPAQSRGRDFCGRIPPRPEPPTRPDNATRHRVLTPYGRACSNSRATTRRRA
jgi:hypothetical protein